MLFAGCVWGQTENSRINIGLLTNTDSGADREMKALESFLNTNEKISYEVITFESIAGNENALTDYDVLWYHKPDTAEFTSAETGEESITAINNYVNNGGGLLLTLDAFKYIVPLGVETNEPELRYKKSQDSGYGRMLGFHAFRNHPVFTGLNGGSYIYKPPADVTVRQFGYFEDNLPANAKVAAVDWDYIYLRENKKIVLEYESGKGKILAIGGYTYYDAENVNRLHLEKFTENCLRYLSGGIPETNKYYWNYGEQTVEEFDSDLPEMTIPAPVEWEEYNDDMTLTSRYASENFFDVAGERLLVMGKENGGIDEIWAHPFMALRDYQVGVKFSYRDTVYWFNDQEPRIDVNPESFTRLYKFPRAYITEVITPSVKEPSAVIHYEYRGVYPAKLVVKYKSNFRYMWPYSSKVFTKLYYDWNDENNCAVITDESGDFVTMVGGNKKASVSVMGRYDDFTVADSAYVGKTTEAFMVGVLAEYDLKANDNLDLVITATNEGIEEAGKSYKAAMANPEKIRNKTKEYTDEVINNSLIINTPDDNFNLGYKWALIGSDRFFANTPGLGKSLMAGYSTTATGWGGGHPVSGRPGYAWYFGRDSEWSGLAFLDFGDYDKVRSVLEFLQTYQDLNGKIFHEVSTSGFIHYDASDATPLYLVLAGRYLRHSGDVEFIRESWKHIKHAIDFCFSTDTDGDHLIENTNVGHGWVEGGELFGSHSSLYLSASWAKALEESAYIAEALGKKDLADYYTKESEIVAGIINTDFWNNEEDIFYHGKFIDGTYHKEPTTLQTIPLYFGMVDDEARQQRIINLYAGNQFSPDWGIRIVSENSPFFKPYGYHNGSVWPLFTGWTSLAEYKYGNHLQGYFHVTSSLNVYKYWAKGFVEEVINGIEFKPTGVCRHQCWSETMVLQPLIEGMLGLECNALENTMTLAPAFPVMWDNVSVTDIRLEDAYVNMDYTRKGNKTVYKFTKDNNGGDVNVFFNPSFPYNTEIKSVKINGESAKTDSQSGAALEFTLAGETTIEIEHENGIGVLPIETNPKPGYPSKGLRILEDGSNNGTYEAVYQSNEEGKQAVKLYSQKAITQQDIENAELISVENGIYTLQIDFSEKENGYFKTSFSVKTK